jgi:hypothetical protein
MTGGAHFANGMNALLKVHAGVNPRNDRSLPRKRNVFPDSDDLARRTFLRGPANSFVTIHFVNQSTRKVPSAWNGSTIAPHLHGVLEFQYLDAVYGVSSHGNNHSPVQPKGLYRRGSLQTHRHLPGAPAQRSATPQSRVFTASGRRGPGSRSRGRAVVLHQLRSPGGHHAPPALPALAPAQFRSSAPLNYLFTVACAPFRARLSRRGGRVRYFRYWDWGPRDCPVFQACCTHEPGA